MSIGSTNSENVKDLSNRRIFTCNFTFVLPNISAAACANLADKLASPVENVKRRRFVDRMRQCHGNRRLSLKAFIVGEGAVSDTVVQ